MPNLLGKPEDHPAASGSRRSPAETALSRRARIPQRSTCRRTPAQKPPRSAVFGNRTPAEDKHSQELAGGGSAPGYEPKSSAGDRQEAKRISPARKREKARNNRNS